MFSRGSFFHSAAGLIVQNILSILCFAFIGWAFWHYGWQIGLFHVVVVVVGSKVGLSIFNRLHR